MKHAKKHVSDVDRLARTRAQVRGLCCRYPRILDAVEAASARVRKLNAAYVAGLRVVVRHDGKRLSKPTRLDPLSLDKAVLGRFAQRDLLAIGLTRLAALADVGACSASLAPNPAPKDPVEGAGKIRMELLLPPIEGFGESARDAGVLSPGLFPPSLAEEFLEHLNRRVRMGEFSPRTPATSNPVVDVRDPVVRRPEQNADAHAPVGTPRKSRNWRDVQARLLKMRARKQPFTSLRMLALQLECAQGLVRKAIDRSEVLKGWRLRGHESPKSRKAQTLTEMASASWVQPQGPAPDDNYTDDEIDSAMERLMDVATPEERKSLESLDGDARRRLAVVSLSQERDQESSPLESTPVGVRRRGVPNFKRA